MSSYHPNSIDDCISSEELRCLLLDVVVRHNPKTHSGKFISSLLFRTFPSWWDDYIVMVDHALESLSVHNLNQLIYSLLDYMRDFQKSVLLSQQEILQRIKKHAEQALISSGMENSHIQKYDALVVYLCPC